jgi:hypothetical protein
MQLGNVRKYPWQKLRSQIGRRAEWKKSYSMLLDSRELPGEDWGLVRAHHKWRVGSESSKNEETRRAHGAGGFAAMRVFTRRDGRELILQVVPCSSVADVRSLIPKHRADRLSSVPVVTEKILNAEQLPDVADAMFVELQTEGPASVVKYIIGRVETVLVFVCCVTRHIDWTWDDTRALTSLQARKVRGVLDDG